MAASISCPAGLVMKTRSECVAAYSKPAGEPVALTRIGRPKRGFGVMKARSRDQQRQILSPAPELFEYSGEFLSHLITPIVLDVQAAEHSRLSRRIARNDVDSPSSTGNMVDRRAKLREMEGVPWTEEHVDRRDQQNALRHRAQGRNGDERIERILAVL